MLQRDASVFSDSYAGFLFDMDGTLINSIPVVERVWKQWAERHGFDGNELIKKVHGIRVADVVRSLDLPHLDPEAEAAMFLDEEMQDVEGVCLIPGVTEFLASLPSDRWAIVTSAPRKLADLRLAAAGLTPPAIMVTGEDVEIGKPNPACYLLGAERLGLPANQCLVFEDAPAGMAAGTAAGAAVLAVTSTYSEPLDIPYKEIIDYTGLRAMINQDGRLQLNSNSDELISTYA